MTTGENIRKRRIELHLSQQNLADALGLRTRSSISKIEKNNGRLSQRQLETLANTLKTTVNYLLTGEKEHGSIHNQILSQNEVAPISDLTLQAKKKIAAVILAGGKYRVNKHHIPYQFVTVKNKPIIIYTMEAYQRHPLIDEIFVVCLAGWEDFLPAYAEQYNISKFKGIIPAGERGIQSIKNAVEWLSTSYRATDILVLQEATRPFIDSETITNAIRCCKQYGSAVTYTHLEETTPFLLDKDGKRVTPVDAYSLITIQSPEVYTIGGLRFSFHEAAKIGHELKETICSVFMHNLGRQLTFCEGNHNNLRIVYEEDLKLFEALI